MKGKSVIYKMFVVGVIVLFIGVGIQPVYALTDIEKNIKTDNNSRDNEEYGLIKCTVGLDFPLWYPFCIPTFSIPLTGTIISCKDLDTGKIRIGIAIFGLKIFKSLPIRHDYKIETGILLGQEEYIYNFDGFEEVYFGI